MAYAYLISSAPNLPPPDFRLQFNPDILNLKKSFKDDAANTFGLWKFDKAEAGGAPGGGISGSRRISRHARRLQGVGCALHESEAD